MNPNRNNNNRNRPRPYTVNYTLYELIPSQVVELTSLIIMGRSSLNILYEPMSRPQLEEVIFPRGTSTGLLDDKDFYQRCLTPSLINCKINVVFPPKVVVPKIFQAMIYVDLVIGYIKCVQLYRIQSSSVNNETEVGQYGQPVFEHMYNFNLLMHFRLLPMSLPPITMRSSPEFPGSQFMCSPPLLPARLLCFGFRVTTITECSSSEEDEQIAQYSPWLVTAPTPLPRHEDPPLEAIGDLADQPRLAYMRMAANYYCSRFFDRLNVSVFDRAVYGAASVHYRYQVVPNTQIYAPAEDANALHPQPAVPNFLIERYSGVYQAEFVSGPTPEYSHEYAQQTVAYFAIYEAERRLETPRRNPRFRPRPRPGPGPGPGPGPMPTPRTRPFRGGLGVPRVITKRYQDGNVPPQDQHQHQHPHPPLNLGRQQEQQAPIDLPVSVIYLPHLPVPCLIIHRPNMLPRIPTGCVHLESSFVIGGVRICWHTFLLRRLWNFIMSKFRAMRVQPCARDFSRPAPGGTHRPPYNIVITHSRYVENSYMLGVDMQLNRHFYNAITDNGNYFVLTARINAEGKNVTVLTALHFNFVKAILRKAASYHLIPRNELPLLLRGVDEQQAQQSQAAAAGGEETPEPQAAPSGNLRGDQPRKAAEKSATFSRTNEKDTYKRKGYDKRSPTLTLGKVVFPIYESKPKGKKSRFVSGSKKREDTGYERQFTDVLYFINDRVTGLRPAGVTAPPPAAEKSDDKPAEKEKKNPSGSGKKSSSNNRPGRFGD